MERRTIEYDLVYYLIRTLYYHIWQCSVFIWYYNGPYPVVFYSRNICTNTFSFNCLLHIIPHNSHLTQNQKRLPLHFYFDISTFQNLWTGNSIRCDKCMTSFTTDIFVLTVIFYAYNCIC